MILQRIEGIYNQETILPLIDIGLTRWLFDLRPKSFNFIQQYKFKKIIEDFGTNAENIFLLFSREKKEVVESFLDIIKEVSAKNGGIGKYILEFEDFNSTDNFEKYNFPYYLRIDNRNSIPSHFLKLNNLKGFVIDFNFLHALHEEDTLWNYAENLRSQLGHHKKFTLVLKGDWDSNIFHSINELISFDYLSLPINHKVELSYRVVDKEGLKLNSQYFLKDKNEHSS